MTVRSKYGQTPAKRMGGGSSLPEFDLPRFESSRFDRLRRELTPPRFDLPKFDNGIKLPDQPPANRSARAGQAKLGLNWFSLLEREVSLTAQIRLSSAGSAPSSDAPNSTDGQLPSINTQNLSLPEFDRPKFEPSDLTRLKVEANRPKFDHPRFDESDEL